MVFNNGLVNGSQGVVKKIWFNHGSNPCSHLPAVVFVEFEGYSGPHTQLPLTLAWAVKIHKSQGMTLEKVVVELGPTDFTPGLAFAAISHVKTLKGLAFHSWFDTAQLQKVRETQTMQSVKYPYPLGPSCTIPQSIGEIARYIQVIWQ